MQSWIQSEAGMTLANVLLVSVPGKLGASVAHAAIHLHSSHSPSPFMLTEPPYC